MKKILVVLAILAVSPVLTVAAVSAQTYTFRSSTAVQAYPVRLVVPSIKLDAPIAQMGTNTKGEMAVPDGRTRNVGWYRGGTMPGQLGSAVIAAHVYAAFSNLKNVTVGDSIYVIMSDKSKVQFVVTDRRQQRLAQLSPEFLFNRKDDERLNLITCAGTYRSYMGTYDQRLVVYAQRLDGYSI